MTLRSVGARGAIGQLAQARSNMLQTAFDAFDWTVREVNQFQTVHWVIALGILIAIGASCLRGLGVRGAR